MDFAIKGIDSEEKDSFSNLLKEGKLKGLLQEVNGFVRTYELYIKNLPRGETAKKLEEMLNGRTRQIIVKFPFVSYFIHPIINTRESRYYLTEEDRIGKYILKFKKDTSELLIQSHKFNGIFNKINQILDFNKEPEYRDLKTKGIYDISIDIYPPAIPIAVDKEIGDLKATITINEGRKRLDPNLVKEIEKEISMTEFNFYPRGDISVRKKMKKKKLYGFLDEVNETVDFIAEKAGIDYEYSNCFITSSKPTRNFANALDYNLKKILEKNFRITKVFCVGERNVELLRRSVGIIVESKGLDLNKGLEKCLKFFENFS